MTTATTPGSAAATSWTTWGRTYTADPVRVERPTTHDEVVAAVLRAAADGVRVKPVGAGHSFTDIAVTDGVTLDLSGLSGLLGVDPATRRARVAGGTRLHALPALLAPHGLAMTNLGDIDEQSITGAVSTGTHGTGLALGGLATQVVGLRMVTADGGTLEVGEDDPLLPALVPGLGAYGVITEVTLQLVEAFALSAVERPEPVQDAVDGFLDRARAHDHVEFYWFPHTRTALTKTNTRLPADAPLAPLPAWRRRLDDDLISNGVYELTCRAGARVPALAPVVNKVATRVTGDRSFTDLSHRVFTTRRSVRFREMEYSVPLEQLPEVAREVVRLVERRRWRISFPLEFRCAGADDRWLSTAYQRDSGYLAVHRYWRDADDDYFAEVERLLVAHGGRPHWGKLHTRGAADLAASYPRFAESVALRDRLDPQRRFANAYLDRMLGG